MVHDYTATVVWTPIPPQLEQLFDQCPRRHSLRCAASRSSGPSSPVVNFPAPRGRRSALGTVRRLFQRSRTFRIHRGLVDNLRQCASDWIKLPHPARSRKSPPWEHCENQKLQKTGVIRALGWPPPPCAHPAQKRRHEMNLTLSQPPPRPNRWTICWRSGCW